MPTLDRNSRCPKCAEKFKVRRETIGAVDHPVIGCAGCGLYAVEGDEQFYSRESLGDAGIEIKLLKRAGVLLGVEHARQVRYRDCEAGEIKA